RHLAMRHLQRPRRVDQELRLREGARRPGRRGELRAVLRGHLGRLRAGLVAGSDDARRVEAVSEEAGRTVRPDRQDQRAETPARDRAPRRVRHRPDLHRAGPRRLPDAVECGRRASGDAAVEPGAPGPGGAGRNYGRTTLATTLFSVPRIAWSGLRGTLHLPA